MGLLFIIRIIQADNISQFNEHIGKELVAEGMEYFIIILYMVFVYKFFVISVLFCTSTIFINAIINYIFAQYNFTLLWGIGVAVLFFILALVLSEIITRAIYKVQPSIVVQSASLRRYI